MPARTRTHRLSAFRPRKGPRLAGLAAAALFVLGSIAALIYGLTRPEAALRWPTVAGAIAYIINPICVLILVIAALNERRPPARLALSAPAALLALLTIMLGAFSPAEVGGLNLFCFGPLAILVALIPLLSWRQTPDYLQQERLQAQGDRLRAYLDEHEGMARYREAARALGMADLSLRTLIADLEANGDLAGIGYPEVGLYVSAPGEERGVARLEVLLAEGVPHDAAALAERLGVPEPVAADWLGMIGEKG